MTTQTINKISFKNVGWIKRQVFKRFASLSVGSIDLIDSEQCYQFGNSSDRLKVTITIHDQDFYKLLVWRGSIGAAESYIAGQWDCDNLTALMQIIIANDQILKKLEMGLAAINTLFGILKSTVMRNRIRNSKVNITAHYDLSNAFFNTFLDERLQYSCAEFTNSAWSLEQAQTVKLQNICEKLNLSPDDHLLEIGSGWGGLAIYAVQHFGCRVTTTTISDAQYHYVKDKISKLGLDQKITLLNQDYRLLTGQFDKLVSIEMIEAVGHQYYKQYFEICNQLLKPGGKFVMQAITIRDNEYERYKYEIDFIKTYIFPGGCLPCIAEIANAVKLKTQMVIQQLDDMSLYYASTLQHWQNRFSERKLDILKMGFNTQFIRMFQFYFSYCEAGFLERYINCVQFTFNKR